MSQELRTELSRYADEIATGKIDAHTIKSDVRDIAKSYGLGMGYIFNRLTMIIESKKALS